MSLLTVDREVSRHPCLRNSPSAPFAHESELLMASLFDAYSLNWQYEPREFVLERDQAGNTRCAFRPDFYLPDFDLYVELTVMRQSLVTPKNRKIRKFRSLYPEVNFEILYRNDVQGILSRHGINEDGKTV